MKVSSTDQPPRQVALDIEVEQERVDSAVEQAYRRLAGRVDVPGFRRGKAPRAMVERILGRDRIVEEALEQLVPVVVNEAIEQQGLQPYTRPRVESVEFDPLRLRATVPLAPSVELGDYQRDLRVAVEEPKVDAEQVDAVIQRLREGYAQWVPVERPVQIGDRVGIDVKGEVVEGGRAILDSRDAEYVVDPEGAEPATGFAHQLVGMAAGSEKTFTLPLPEDYRDRALAGQPVAFSVRLHWVKEKELPEVDDAFAQQVGDYADVAALRASVEKELREREEQRVREELEAAVVDKLAEISTVEFPPQLVEHEADHMVETFTRTVQQQGLQLEQYLRLTGRDQETFREDMRAEAARRIRRSLVLDAFAEAEHIGVEPTEVEDEVRKATAGTSEAEAAQMAALGDPTTMARVESVLRERKALGRLVELATGGESASPAPAKSRARKIAAESQGAADTGAEAQEEQLAAASAASEVQENR